MALRQDARPSIFPCFHHSRNLEPLPPTAIRECNGPLAGCVQPLGTREVQYRSSAALGKRSGTPARSRAERLRGIHSRAVRANIPVSIFQTPGRKRITDPSGARPIQALSPAISTILATAQISKTCEPQKQTCSRVPGRRPGTTANPQGGLLSLDPFSLTHSPLSILPFPITELMENMIGMKKEDLEIPQLVGTERAAEILARSAATLKRWRCEGIGPEYVQIEGRVRYDLRILLEFIERNTRVPSVRAAMEETRGVV